MNYHNRDWVVVWRDRPAGYVIRAVGDSPHDDPIIEIDPDNGYWTCDDPKDGCEGLASERRQVLEHVVATHNACSGLNPDGIPGLVKAVEAFFKDDPTLFHPSSWKHGLDRLKNALAAVKEGR